MTDARKRLLAGCLGSALALALALLAWAAFHADSIRDLDARLLAHLSADRFGRLGHLANPVADLGNPLPQVLLLVAGVAVALYGGRREAAATGFAIVLGANLTTLFLKHAFAAPRFDPVLGWAQVGGHPFPAAMPPRLSRWPRRGRSSCRRAGAGRLPSWLPPRLARRCLGGCPAPPLPSDVLGGLLVAAVWMFGVLASRAHGVLSDTPFEHQHDVQRH